MERAVNLCLEDKVTVEDLPPQFSSPSDPAVPARAVHENHVTQPAHDTARTPDIQPPQENRRFYSIRENEESLILSALEECQGNVTASSRLLNMNLRTLYRKIDKYGIDVDTYRHRK